MNLQSKMLYIVLKIVQNVIKTSKVHFSVQQDRRESSKLEKVCKYLSEYFFQDFIVKCGLMLN